MNQNGDAVALAALALAGTSVTAIIWMSRWAVKQLAHDLKAHTVAAIKQTKSNTDLQKAVNHNSQMVLNADTYLRERNGRDSEVHAQLMGQLSEIPKIFYSTELQRTKEFKAIMKALPKTTTTVNVKEQKVQHQEVKKQEIKGVWDGQWNAKWARR